MNPDEYVQPLVLRRSGTHEDAVHAVAEASLRAFVATAEDPDFTDRWRGWLNIAFVKSVRRARNGEFEAVRPMAQAFVPRGEAAALGFAPSRYTDLPHGISKLQVSGTDFERAGWNDAPARVVVAIDEGLGMTTGKAAAQAAHGVFATYLRMDDLARAAWAEDDFAFRVEGVPSPRFRRRHDDAFVAITDAGRTEVDPGTATVLVLVE